MKLELTDQTKQFTKAISLIENLHADGYEAFIVGGAVRDMLLGLKPYDVDIVTNASYNDMELVFENHKIVEVGRNFGVMIVDGVEVATYRKDISKGKRPKDDEVVFVKDLFADTARRDFTINSMAYDILSGELIDYHNGRKDLENRIIRFVGDPMERIWEDPNRMIRACRFVAKIDGTFDEDTVIAIIKSVDKEWYRISQERIREEIMKAMKIKKASRFFCRLHKFGMLKKIFPSLVKGYKHPHGPHHIEFIFDHNMMAGDYVSPKYPLIKLTAYLHDAGKPAASKINPRTNDLFFTGHAGKGADIVAEELKNLTFSNDDIHFITTLIRYHMRNAINATPKSIRRFLRIMADEDFKYTDFLRLRCADKAGNLGTRPYTLPEIRKMVNKFETQLAYTGPQHPLADLAVNGHDVMEAAGITPGPLVGKILNQLMFIVTDDPEKNNKETLIEAVKTLTSLHNGEDFYLKEEEQENNSFEGE